MKKALGLVLSLLIVCSAFAGCAGGSPSPSPILSPSPSPEPSPEPLPSPASSPLPSPSSEPETAELTVDANGNISFATFLTDVVQERNNCSGHAGMVLAFKEDITVTSLGRYLVEGNSQVHTLRIIHEDKTVLAEVDIDAATYPLDPLGFQCADLETPVTLKAGEYYFFLSSEIEGGDLWYGDTTLTDLHPSVATDGDIWGGNILVPDLDAPWYVSPSMGCYGPLNFYYAGTPG